MARKKKEPIIEELEKAEADLLEEKAEEEKEKENETLDDKIEEAKQVASEVSDVAQKKAAEAKEEAKEKADKLAAKWNEAEDKTAEFDKDDIEKNRAFAILGYFGLLVLIPLIFAPNSKFARFHANQSLVLFVISMTYWFFASCILAIIFLSSKFFGFLFLLIFLVVSLFLFVMWVQGISNAANGKARNLPFVGTWELLDLDD
ncbi:MAG: hypothetical protein KBS43_05820 [Oscillospiraceae bacterium]|nr:hypothetical protein [Candidatus Limimonas coprohippi]